MKNISYLITLICILAGLVEVAHAEGAAVPLASPVKRAQTQTQPSAPVPSAVAVAPKPAPKESVTSPQPPAGINPGVTAPPKPVYKFPWTTLKAKIEKIDGDDLEGFSWEQNEVVVEERPQGNYILLEGNYRPRENSDEKKWALLVRTREVALENGRFRILIPIESQQTILLFRVVGPDGQVGREVVSVTVIEAPKPKRPSNWNFLASAGYTTSTYKQTYYNPISMTGITTKFTARMQVKPSKWDAGSTLFFTALPLSQSWSKTASGSVPAINIPKTLSARFFGFNFRVGYTVPSVKEPWGLTLLGGFYYTTMKVTATMPASAIDRTPGYQNQFGPQVFPAIRRHLGGGHILGAYLKYAPLLDGISGVKMSNRELAFGLTYSRPFFTGHSLVGALDFSQLDYAKATGMISLSTSSFSLGYTF